MSQDDIRKNLHPFISKYSIKSIILFGSRADGSNTEKSDVDLILEFNVPVSLLTLSQIRLEMEQALELGVDIVHGPIRDYDMLDIDSEVVLYAA